MNTSISFEEAHEDLLADPERAALYLSELISDDNISDLLQGLGDIVRATDGIQTLAEEQGLNRVSLYRTLAAEGNPKLDTLLKILDHLQMQLSIVAKSAAEDVLDFRYDRVDESAAVLEQGSFATNVRTWPLEPKDHSLKADTEWPVKALKPRWSDQSGLRYAESSIVSHA